MFKIKKIKTMQFLAKNLTIFILMSGLYACTKEPINTPVAVYCNLINEKLYSFSRLSDFEKKKFDELKKSRFLKFKGDFVEAAQTFDIEWELLAAVAFQESQWNPKARSATQVKGMMMLTLPTAASVGVTNRLDPIQSIYGGAQYLSDLPILYDILFRSSISFNMLFLEEIWSRNFTNLFIAPLKLKEIIVSLIFTALIRTLIGLVPAVLLTSPLFGVSILKLGFPLLLLFLSLYLFGITLGLFVSAGLIRFGPSFENIAWSSLFLLAPLGCIYYPIEILPNFFQIIAKGLPLVYIFDETRNILLNGSINYVNLKLAYLLNFVYLTFGISLFYFAFLRARTRGTLINMGE